MVPLKKSGVDQKEENWINYFCTTHCGAELGGKGWDFANEGYTVANPKKEGILTTQLPVGSVGMEILFNPLTTSTTLWQTKLKTSQLQFMVMIKNMIKFSMDEQTRSKNNNWLSNCAIYVVHSLSRHGFAWTGPCYYFSLQFNAMCEEVKMYVRTRRDSFISHVIWSIAASSTDIKTHWTPIRVM